MNESCTEGSNHVSVITAKSNLSYKFSDSKSILLERLFTFTRRKSNFLKGHLGAPSHHPGQHQNSGLQQSVPVASLGPRTCPD